MALRRSSSFSSTLTLYRPSTSAPSKATPLCRKLHLRCRRLRHLNLSPLARVPRLTTFNCVFGGGELDVTPLRAHPSLTGFGYGTYVIDPDTDPVSITSPAVKGLISKGRLQRRGVRPEILPGVRWTFGRSFTGRGLFTEALSQENALWVDELAVPGRTVRIIYEDLASNEPPRMIDVAADRREGTSSSELLWRINEILASVVRDRDRRFFEGLALLDTPLGEPPTYSLRLGS